MLNAAFRRRNKKGASASFFFCFNEKPLRLNGGVRKNYAERRFRGLFVFGDRVVVGRLRGNRGGLVVAVVNEYFAILFDNTGLHGYVHLSPESGRQKEKYACHEVDCEAIVKELYANE